ncbi:hypothetical protein KIN20_014611 [Parelaphostrongylus tenuis]|uniref:Uncharacterized protein n=1 Tax=Parelaphostrongylus tenuis TaxID=148309 RepID=A0AAD5MF62_PARTN|nr:hypothetical protein KIN20_014611 [Parelaphostrongylus tenuis]
MVGTNQPSRRCIIVGGDTVTGFCSEMMPMARAQMCETAPMEKITVVPASHTKKNLCRPNIIMANWSKAMWRSVLNRAVRRLALGSLGSNSSRTDCRRKLN